MAALVLRIKKRSFSNFTKVSFPKSPSHDLVVQELTECLL